MMKDDGTFFREVEHDLWCPHARTTYCDRVGVDVQVLSTVPVMFSYWAKPEDTLEVCRYLNDHISSLVKKHPTRFVGLASLPMQDPKLAVKELRRCMTDLNMCGIQIGSHVNDWTLDDPRLFPIFQECEKLGACIFVHPWDMMGRDLMKKYWLPWLVSMPAETSLAICSFIFGGIFERLPKLRVLFAHGGGSFPATAGRVQHGFDCRPDLCAVDNPVSPHKYLGRFWVDSLLHGTDMMKYVLSLLGNDRVCLGSDYPFPLGECYPLKRPGDLIASSGLSDEVVRNIFCENALSWLGVRGERRKLLTDVLHRRGKSVREIQRQLSKALSGRHAIVGKSRQDSGEMCLEIDGTFECRFERRNLIVSGKWKIGTYTSAATPTGDVVLHATTTSSSSSSSSSPLLETFPWFPQATPFELKVHVQKDRVHGPLDVFREEHVKRRSGKNALIEGQRASKI